MAVRIWVAIALVGACFSSTQPPPTISNASTPVARPAIAEIETWTGTGYQPDAGRWTIEMRINRAARVHERLGTIEYPSLGCSGELIRDLDRGVTIVAIEKLLVNPDGACVDGGTIVLRDDGETLDWRWYYTNGTQGATSTLRRAPPR